MKRLFLSMAAAALLCCAGNAHAGVLADLSADWSDTSSPNNSNPNGTWEYREGTTDLPSTNPWTAAGTFASPSQPAWAPSNNAGSFLPAEFKANATSASQFAPGNVQVGDVITHTQDAFNGSGEGQANYLFTSNLIAGPVVISGMVWDAGINDGRPQQWLLYLDGSLIDSGTLSGAVERANAESFDLDETMNIGDTLELVLERACTDCGSAGYFVGSDLTISTADRDVPEPASILLLAPALFGLAAMRRRRGA